MRAGLATYPITGELLEALQLKADTKAFIVNMQYVRWLELSMRSREVNLGVYGMLLLAEPRENRPSFAPYHEFRASCSQSQSIGRSVHAMCATE